MIRTHLQDLKDVTNNILYENFRCRKLGGTEFAKQQRSLNKLVYELGTFLRSFSNLIFRNIKRNGSSTIDETS